MPTAEDLLPPSIGTPGGLLTEVCDALDAELEWIDALRSRHLSSIRIYRALGGGWK